MWHIKLAITAGNPNGNIYILNKSYIVKYEKDKIVSRNEYGTLAKIPGYSFQQQNEEINSEEMLV